MKADKGDFIACVGESGSGKSTLLNLIAGLLVPSSGEILIDGENVGGGSDKNLAYIRNTRIGYVPQGQSLLSNLTVFILMTPSSSIKNQLYNLLYLNLFFTTDYVPSSFINMTIYPFPTSIHSYFQKIFHLMILKHILENLFIKFDPNFDLFPT